MRFISTQPDVPGIIAIGQVATGVIAIGQVSLGVIAIGQLARGVIVVGQLAVGVFTVGQLSLGVGWAVGMLGVAARGKGIVIPLLPRLRPPRERPAPESITTPERLAARDDDEGWVLLELRAAGDAVELTHRGERFESEIDTMTALRLREAAEAGAREVYLFVRAEQRRVQENLDYRAAPEEKRVLGATAVMVADAHWQNPFVTLSEPARPVAAPMVALRLAGLAVCVALWWVIVGAPLAAMLSRL